jgi:pectin methylesterase-like acyl-CoA thioesterase
LYVNPAGNDTSSGTQDQPLQTIQEAVDQAGPGTTIHLQPGEYRQDIEIRSGGEPDNPIEITGPPDAVIIGRGSETT